MLSFYIYESLPPSQAEINGFSKVECCLVTSCGVKRVGRLDAWVVPSSAASLELYFGF